MCETPLVGEDVPVGFALPRDEEIQNLILEREEVLEQALKLIGPASPGLTEVLELVLQQLFAGACIEDEKNDVEQEAGLLHVDLAVIGLAVDRRDVFLRLVTGAVFDAELERPGDDDVAVGHRAQRAPELRGSGELGEILSGQLHFGGGFDDLELRLFLELLLQEAMEFRLQIDISEPLVPSLF